MALSLVADMAKQAWFTFGEFKALIYVYYRMTVPIARHCQTRLGRRSPSFREAYRGRGGSVEYRWSRGLKQFRLILEKIVDYYKYGHALGSCGRDWGIAPAVHVMIIQYDYVSLFL